MYKKNPNFAKKKNKIMFFENRFSFLDFVFCFHISFHCFYVNREKITSDPNFSPGEEGSSY